jgi:PAS domain S-box-containing protein
VESSRKHPSLNLAELSTPLHIVILVCLVAMLSYLVPKLAGALLFYPQTAWPLWPGNAVLVSMLLLVPRRVWPLVIPVAFGAFLLYDVEVGVPIGSVAWFIPANTVEVLIAALCLGHFFHGVPRLTSLKALSRYLFFAALLAPFAAAFLGAFGVHDNYWTSWRICFFSEVLAFVTLTPAILVWVSDGPVWVRRSRGYHLEFAALIFGLAVLGYVAFSAFGATVSPAALYYLVPFLLWAALRFGPIGISTAVIVLTLLAVWHVARGGGPFANGGPFGGALSIQMFLVFAAIPFMVLASVVEQRKQTEEELRENAERLRLAMEAGKLGGWEWNLKTGQNPWFGSAQRLLGITSSECSGSIQDFWDRVHPDHRQQLLDATESAKHNREEYDQEFRVVWPDATQHWLRSRGRFFYGPDGEPERMLGVSADITELKSAEQASQSREADLKEAQRLAKVGGWRCDPDTDTVTWSEELYRIAGRDPSTRAMCYQEQSKLFTAQSRERLQHAVEEALRAKTPYEIDLEMVRPDGTIRWIVARGEAVCDASGRVVQLRGTAQDITERRLVDKNLRESEERFRLAAQAGKMFAYEWDAATDVLVRSEESTKILGINATTPATGHQMFARVHPHDRGRLTTAIAELTPDKPFLEITYRMVRPDNTVIWVQRNSRAHFDDTGKMLRIVGMVSDITERRRTEDALRKSETWLGMAVRAGRMYAFEWDTATDVILRTGECETIFNWMADPTRVSGRQFIAGMHPDDRAAFHSTLAALSPENPIYRPSYRILRPDGSVVWLEANGRAYFDSEGKRLRIIGMVSDVTARQLAEEALASVSRRLIDAQDQERAHIARELHDDLSQRMALLQIGLEQFEQDAAELSPEDRQHLQKIAEVAMDVSSNIRDLSHQLHPSKLDTLGLLPSLSSFCKEFSKQYNLQLQFVHQGIAGPIPRDLSLCLFRIVQEALRNVVKHSGATEAKVDLFFPGDRIDLSISDSGSGFSPESTKTEAGLGLVSMRERLRLVGGRLTIESKPSHGTRIYASVPLVAKDGTPIEGKAEKARA